MKEFFFGVVLTLCVVFLLAAIGQQETIKALSTELQNMVQLVNYLNSQCLAPIPNKFGA